MMLIPNLNLQTAEARIRVAFDAGELHAATTLAIGLYGADILAFLRARLRSQTQADDVFLQFSEDLWLGIGGFRWESSLRAWLFTLARNAANRLGRFRVRRREVPWSTEHERFLHTIGRIRTKTALSEQTSVKTRIRELREQLDEDQQTLLILRIGRQLEWKELAVVMGEAASGADEEELARASARMRTRFQAAKRRLRELAEQDGLVKPTDDP